MRLHPPAKELVKQMSARAPLERDGAGGGRTIAWTSDDLPAGIARDGVTRTFFYGGIGKSIRHGVESLSGSGRCSTLVGFQGAARPAKAA
jgi:hypothetical protein